MSSPWPGISVVIPAIDEAEHLPGLLADIVAQRDIDCEMIVVDGGSTDATRDVALAAGARWLESPPGRARQMNAGAAVARREWLLFLHADCRLTDVRQLRGACERQAAELDRARPMAGHFALRFVDRGIDRREPDRFLFRYMAAKTRTCRRYTINGDQGLLIARSAFEALGGFDTTWGFLEDQRMAGAIDAAGGAFCQLPGELATSARRFRIEGLRRRYALMALIMAMYLADVPCFFRRAPRVYARQGRTGPLALGPYIALIGSMARDCGPRSTLAVTWRVAGIVLGQTWQLPFMFDVWRAGEQAVDARVTRAYDRFAARLIEQPLSRMAVLIALLLFGVGPAVLYAVCWARHSN